MTEHKPSQHVDAWWEFLGHKLNERIYLDELVEDLEEVGFHELFDYIHKQGWRDLGNGCELVKCHGCDRDAMCFLVPFETSQTPTGTATVCSGPLYPIDDGGKWARVAKWMVTPMGEQSEKRKRKLGGGRHKVVVELPHQDCPYGFSYQDIDVDELYEQQFD